MEGILQLIANKFFTLFILNLFDHIFQIKDSIVTGIPFTGTEISASPSPIMCAATSPLPSSSTTSSDNILLPSLPTHKECATAGVPDQTSESCDENSDEVNTTSSSQEDRSA